MAQIIKPRLKTSIKLRTTVTKHTQNATITPRTKPTVAVTTKIRITVEAAEKTINQCKNKKTNKHIN